MTDADAMGAQAAADAVALRPSASAIVWTILAMSPLLYIAGYVVVGDPSLWWGALLITGLPGWVLAKVGGTWLAVDGAVLTLTEFVFRRASWPLAEVSVTRGAAGDGLVLPGVLITERASGAVIRRVVATPFRPVEVRTFVEKCAALQAKMAA